MDRAPSGHQPSMPTTGFATEDLDDAWIEGDETARWSSGNGHHGAASAVALLEVAPGCRLPRHTDSAEENIVVLEGSAEAEVGGDRLALAAGDVALVPADVPHEVRNAGDAPLRFFALYSARRNVTTFEVPVAPDGKRERESGA